MNIYQEGSTVDNRITLVVHAITLSDSNAKGSSFLVTGLAAFILPRYVILRANLPKSAHF